MYKNQYNMKQSEFMQNGEIVQAQEMMQQKQICL